MGLPSRGHRGLRPGRRALRPGERRSRDLGSASGVTYAPALAAAPTIRLAGTLERSWRNDESSSRTPVRPAAGDRGPPRARAGARAAHRAHGGWPVKPAPPFVPGHEGVGTVHAIGDGVTRLTEGDLVAVPWLGHACGTCNYCLTGWETLCLAQRNTGYSVDGGYAEYFLAEAAFATKVPAGVNPFEAAPLTCAGVTTFKAVKVGNVRPGDLVAVSGIGGLGHLAL